MTYFADPNHIEYDEWFDENIDPLDLKYYKEEKISVTQFTRGFMTYQKNTF